MFSHGDKVDLIGRYLADSGRRVMVETGLYGGGGSGMNFVDRLDLYVILDMDAENCLTARANFPAAVVVSGDSGKTLPGLLERLHVPALFWLDAHLVADIDETAALDKWPCPLLDELAAIHAWPHAYTSTILIDDVRLFGSYGWPNRADVLAACHGWQLAEADDILRLTPLT